MNKGRTRRIIEYLITFICIITLNFMLPRLMPGDPFTFLSTDQGSISITFTEEQIERYKAYYGLDQPLHQQYRQYITKMLHGDLGYSIYFNDAVTKIVAKRAVWTVTLVLAAIVFSCLAGILLGSISAWYRHGRLDKALYLVMIVFSEIPPFLIGIVFLFVFAAKLGLFPLAGAMRTFAVYNSPWERAFDLVHHALLPVATLALARVGGFYLLARNSMIAVLSKDYMRTARAKGLHQRRVIFRHALKNALLPVVTRIFLSLGMVFSGAILVENVFNYPGLGRLMMDAVLFRDYVLVQGVFMFVTTTVLIMNLLADEIYKKLDPRVKT